MRKTTNIAIAFLNLAVFVPQIANAQGTLYVSSIVNVARVPLASIASDSWIAELIETGNDSSGYVLNSIQLEMVSATLSPSGFNVSVYSDVNNIPSSDLGTLTGSSNPSTSGLYTYSASDLTLAPSTEYFIVTTAATPSAQGSYTWLGGNGPPAPGIDQWMIYGMTLKSADQGSDWTSYPSGVDFQMAIYATAIPEPLTWILCLLGGGFAFYVHARQQAASQAKLN